jgi:hypothetical protein
MIRWCAQFLQREKLNNTLLRSEGKSRRTRKFDEGIRPFVDGLRGVSERVSESVELTEDDVGLVTASRTKPVDAAYKDIAKLRLAAEWCRD